MTKIYHIYLINKMNYDRSRINEKSFKDEPLLTIQEQRTNKILHIFP